MTYNPDIHHRRSIRIKGYDYSASCAYFITVCAQNRECLFGEIVSDEMVLNTAGQLLESCLGEIPTHFSDVAIDRHVIMPNHCHAIIWINASSTDEGAVPQPERGGDRAGVRRGAVFAPYIVSPPRPRPTLGQIIGYFKYQSTKKINLIRGNPASPVWQRNYYERVIRDENELARAREYIINNPLQWAMDKENPINPSLRRP